MVADTTNVSPNDCSKAALSVTYGGAPYQVTDIWTPFTYTPGYSGLEFDVMMPAADSVEIVLRTNNDTVCWRLSGQVGSDLNDGTSGDFVPDQWYTVKAPFANFVPCGYGEAQTVDAATLALDLHSADRATDPFVRLDILTEPNPGATGSGTSLASSLATAFYDNFFFAPADKCFDGIKNQDETDVDCGGNTCGTCIAGQACLLQADCVAADNCDTGTLVCTPKVQSCSPAGVAFDDFESGIGAWHSATGNPIGADVDVASPNDCSTESMSVTYTGTENNVTGDAYRSFAAASGYSALSFDVLMPAQDEVAIVLRPVAPHFGDECWKVDAQIGANALSNGSAFVPGEWYSVTLNYSDFEPCGFGPSEHDSSSLPAALRAPTRSSEPFAQLDILMIPSPVAQNGSGTGTAAKAYFDNFRFITPDTCFNGTQDGDETGTDCGGSCEACGGERCSSSCTADGVGFTCTGSPQVCEAGSASSAGTIDDFSGSVAAWTPGFTSAGAPAGSNVIASSTTTVAPDSTKSLSITYGGTGTSYDQVEMDHPMVASEAVEFDGIQLEANLPFTDQITVLLEVGAFPFDGGCWTAAAAAPSANVWNTIQLPYASFTYCTFQANNTGFNTLSDALLAGSEFSNLAILTQVTPTGAGNALQATPGIAYYDNLKYYSLALIDNFATGTSGWTPGYTTPEDPAGSGDISSSTATVAPDSTKSLAITYGGVGASYDQVEMDHPITVGIAEAYDGIQLEANLPYTDNITVMLQVGAFPFTGGCWTSTLTAPSAAEWNTMQFPYSGFTYCTYGANTTGHASLAAALLAGSAFSNLSILTQVTPGGAGNALSGAPGTAFYDNITYYSANLFDDFSAGISGWTPGYTTPEDPAGSGLITSVSSPAAPDSSKALSITYGGVGATYDQVEMDHPMDAAVAAQFNGVELEANLPYTDNITVIFEAGAFPFTGATDGCWLAVVTPSTSNDWSTLQLPYSEFTWCTNFGANNTGFTSLRQALDNNTNFTNMSILTQVTPTGAGNALSAAPGNAYYDHIWYLR